MHRDNEKGLTLQLCMAADVAEISQELVSVVEDSGENERLKRSDEMAPATTLRNHWQVHYDMALASILRVSNIARKGSRQDKKSLQGNTGFSCGWKERAKLAMVVDEENKAIKAMLVDGGERRKLGEKQTN